MITLLPSEIALLSGVAAVLAAVEAISQAATARVAARHTGMDRLATATPTVAAARTPPDKARPTIVLTAPARHTMKAGARPIRMPTAVKLRVNTGKARHTRTLTGARRRLNMEKVPPFERLWAGRVWCVRRRCVSHPRLWLAQYHPRKPCYHPPQRSTTTDQHAPTAEAGQLRELSQLQLLPVRLSLQQTQTLPMLMPMLRRLSQRLQHWTQRRHPATATTTQQPPPRQPWLRHQATIPRDRWLRRSRLHYSTVQGTTYYLCGNTGSAPGAGGVYCRVSGPNG
jgi:hypothetical protein